MTITEKVSYLKGLAEGLKISDDKAEGKLLLSIIDVLDDMALTIEDLDDGLAEVCEQMDEIDEDLGTLEEEYYSSLDEDLDDDDFCLDDDDAIYEVECPSCNETICIDEEMLEEGEINCPSCGELLEFDLQDDCDCCGHGHHHDEEK